MLLLGQVSTMNTIRKAGNVILSSAYQHMVYVVLFYMTTSCHDLYNTLGVKMHRSRKQKCLIVSQMEWKIVVTVGIMRVRVNRTARKEHLHARFVDFVI